MARGRKDKVHKKDWREGFAVLEAAPDPLFFNPGLFIRSVYRFLPQLDLAACNGTLAVDIPASVLSLLYYQVEAPVLPVRR